MNLTNGKIWPYAIGTSIIFIFGACVATIVVASSSPVEKSNTYMTYYQDADANANKLIESRIDFDKKYKIEYITDSLSTKNSSIKYRVTDLDSNIVNDAKIKLLITRPDNNKYNQSLENPTLKDGVYSFEGVELEKEGRWNIIAKVNVGEANRFYNVKADTRYPEAFEY